MEQKWEHGNTGFKPRPTELNLVMTTQNWGIPKWAISFDTCSLPRGDQYPLN